MTHEDRLKRLLAQKDLDQGKKGSVVNDKLRSQLREQPFEEQLNLLSPDPRTQQQEGTREPPQDVDKTEPPTNDPPQKTDTPKKNGPPPKVAPRVPKNIAQEPTPTKEKESKRVERLMGYLGYEDMEQKLKDPENARLGMKVNEELSILLNGGLFMEAVNLEAEKDYRRNKEPEIAETSNEEKLHVPATAKDVSKRWAIVSKLCLARGIVNWKVAKQELLANKVSGTDTAFQLLSKAGLLDKDAQPGLPASGYVKQALKTDRRKVLQGFLGNPKNFDRLPEGELAQQIVVKCENAVLDQNAFPEEQSGREITIYIKPKLMKDSKAWSAFVSELFEAFASSGLPMLPIAVGDESVAGGGVSKNGQTLGYFSYRNEANAKDEELDYVGFPHWMGGNADKANAAKQSMQLDKAKVKLGKHGKKAMRMHDPKPKPKSKWRFGGR